MNWELINKESLIKTIPFEVEKLHFRHLVRNEKLAPYYRLHCKDWVTVVAITTNDDSLFVKQPRAGSLDYSLETPGGMIDSADPNLTSSALRELEEETGYTSSNIRKIGSINPNPALFDNKLHIFLALECDVKKNRKCFPDPEEEIKLIKIPWKSVRRDFSEAGIDSALSALAILQANSVLDSMKYS